MWRAALGGLLLGALIAFLIEFLRPRRPDAEPSYQARWPDAP